MSKNTGLRLPLLQGLLPITAHSASRDVLAGITLAALGIPEVLGYAKIAGMPVVTGLYTILLPIAVFAVVGSSRHLVVGADSATAAVLAAGVTGMAAIGSSKYVALAGLAGLITAALLMLARIIRLGFLANFLSRTVLIGFLTGVGIQVAATQIAEMLGVRAKGHGTVAQLVGTVVGLPSLNLPTVLVSASVIVIVVGMRFIARRVPGALIAVVASIVVARIAGLQRFGVHVLGHVPSGVPSFTIPPLNLSAALALLGPAVSMFIVILAQSAATSRAYAAKYEETFNENEDLVGLSLANVAASFTGTFVVNGSPTKTQMVDSAGGRSQLAQLTTAVAVLLVLLFLTGPLGSLPLAVLATIVFLIGIELIDIRGLRRILAVRRVEFVIALITTAAVVFIGVEQGIIVAIVASIVDHLRHSYSPRRVILTPAGPDNWNEHPVTAGRRSAPGLVIYRFGSSLYYANAHQLLKDVTTITSDTAPLTVFCLDFAAIEDVDFTAAAVLRQVHAQLRAHGARLDFSDVPPPVKTELDRYGITELVGDDAYVATPAALLPPAEKPAGVKPAPARRSRQPGGRR